MFKGLIRLIMEGSEPLPEVVWLSRVLRLQREVKALFLSAVPCLRTHSWVNRTVDRSDFLTATVSSVILPQA